MGKLFLSAEWKNLLMANYEINAAVSRPFLPYKTELDNFEGKHYVSLVGFLFAHTKVLGLQFPFHQIFEEVNLRFYVRYKEDDKWKRGVVFLKEIVPRRIIAFIANTIYGENYRTHRMKHTYKTAQETLEVAYYWKVGSQWNYMKAIADKQPSILKENSEEEFITEHYWGYTFINDQCSGAYEVQHPKWLIHQVSQYDINCSALTLYGPAFAEALQEKPQSFFLAQGSAINVMKGVKIFL